MEVPSEEDSDGDQQQNKRRNCETPEKDKRRRNELTVKEKHRKQAIVQTGRRSRSTKTG